MKVFIVNKQLKEIILQQIKTGLTDQLSAINTESMEDEFIENYIQSLIDKLYERLKSHTITDHYTDKNWFQTGFFMAIETIGTDV